MPEVNAWLAGDRGRTPYAIAKEQSMARENNFGDPAPIDPGVLAVLGRRPVRWLHVFNISRREFVIRKPPVAPMLRLRPCPEDQKWIEVAMIPDPVIDRWENENRDLLTREIAGARFATDLLNPANLSNDCWGPISDVQFEQVSGGTDDLTRRGVFWSEHEEPTPEELEKAKSRMESHYKALLREGDILARNPKTSVMIGPEHHLAADYFGGGTAKREWHVVAELPAICENCGEEINKGVAYHKNSMGGLCVIDWRRAYNAGVVKMRDIPEERRWPMNE